MARLQLGFACNDRAPTDRKASPISAPEDPQLLAKCDVVLIAMSGLDERQSGDRFRNQLADCQVRPESVIVSARGRSESCGCLSWQSRSIVALRSRLVCLDKGSCGYRTRTSLSEEHRIGPPFTQIFRTRPDEGQEEGAS